MTPPLITIRRGLSPRVRGNHRRRIDRPHPAPSGLSPRVRGNLEELRMLEETLALRVYPRVCGGTQGASLVGAVNEGLSPRNAGEPNAPSSQRKKGRVYPRVCGGTTSGLRASFPVRSQGLSPRVRGNRLNLLNRWRITPWFGLSPRVRGNHCEHSPGDGLQGVYPRVCGGTNSPTESAEFASGLSPRVRGNQVLCAVRCGTRGSIPACAGNRYRDIAIIIHYGSIPACAGNRSGTSDRIPREGSIPACAGEPGLVRCPVWDARVYPRVCGGTPRSGTVGCSRGGLSPRVRGNL